MALFKCECLSHTKSFRVEAITFTLKILYNLCGLENLLIKLYNVFLGYITRIPGGTNINNRLFCQCRNILLGYSQIGKMLRNTYQL